MEYRGWTLTAKNNTSGPRIAVIATRGERVMRIDNSSWRSQEEALQSVQGTLERLERVQPGAAPVLWPGGEGAG